MSETYLDRDLFHSILQPDRGETELRTMAPADWQKGLGLRRRSTSFNIQELVGTKNTGTEASGRVQRRVVVAHRQVHDLYRPADARVHVSGATQNKAEATTGGSDYNTRADDGTTRSAR